MQISQTYTLTRRERLASFGSVIVAFLASQHHALHMLIMLGLGGTSTGFMTAYPLIRRAMLLIALALAGVTAYRLVRHRPPLARRVVHLVSILLTLGLLVWSVSQFGV